MLLTWPTSLKIAAAFAIFALMISRLHRRWVGAVTAVAAETALVFGLYAVWQWARSMGITKVAGAREHALQLWRLERFLQLPNELVIQRALDQRLTMQFLNIYYAVAHVPAAALLLIWLFFRHREHYSRVRTTLALLIFGCLVIQTIPLAPPRFFPELGFVDSGLKYGQSVYGTGGGGISNQLAAMPSQHVGWALLVGITAVMISQSRWRWLVLLHPVLTIVSVTATANHWLLDGVVAGMVLVVAFAVHAGAAAGLRRVRARRVESSSSTPPVPVLIDAL